jgi:hypothetical protein
VMSGVRCFLVMSLEMLNAILQSLKRVVSSRVGHVLLILHLSLVVFEFTQKNPVSRAESNRVYEAREMTESATLLAGRVFHYHYESPLLKFLIFVDMPGIALSFFLGLVLVPINYIAPLGEYDASWAVAGILLIGTSTQWQLIGYGLERMIRSGRSSERRA